MVPKIIPLIPKHTVYVEPYAGGAAVLFMKPWPDVAQQYYVEVINDLDGDLINLYRQLRNNGQALIERLQLTPYSEEEYRDSKDISGSDLERAAKYFVSISQSFGKKLHGGWGRSTSGGNCAARWMNRVKRLPEYLDRMKSIHIANTPALECIERWDSPQTFFYVDPPYPGTGQGHYGGFTDDDFFQLCEKLDRIKGSFILSNYDSDIPPYYWERFNFKVTSGAARHSNKTTGKRTEVCWRHISDHPVSAAIQKQYDTGKYDCFKGEKDEESDWQF
jgi:DNA adenine methylase